VRSTVSIVRLLALGLLATPTVAGPQVGGISGCEPSVPPGGFTLTELIDTPMTFSDGYVTLTDFRYPSAALIPGCSWPLLTLIHGRGLDKSAVDVVARRLSAQGYAVLSFDFRGAGPSYALNDPLVYAPSLDFLRERIDAFEAFEFAEATWPTLVDETRYGLSGGSLGGIIAWSCAAHSGKVPPPNPWRTAPFPVVSAVVPEAYLPDFREVDMPGGLTISEDYMKTLFAPVPAYLPSDLALVQGLVLNEDWASLEALLFPPALDIPTLLQTSSTPWAIALSYDDRAAAPDAIVDQFNASSPTVPSRVTISTGNHGAPNNDGATDFKQTLKIRWFDRFLKGMQNGVDTEPPIRMLVTPEDKNDYRDRTFVWDKREHTALPPPSTFQRFHLDVGGTLSDVYVGLPGTETIQHRPMIDIVSYSQTLPSATSLMAGPIPLSQYRYKSAPLESDLHMHGQVGVQLYASSQEPRYQVHVALYDAPPVGPDRFVADGWVHVWDYLPPGENVLSFDMQIASYVFRAGHTINLVVQNLTLHDSVTGGAAHLRAIPIFDDFDVAIAHSPTQPSWIDIPVDPLATPSLASKRHRLTDGAWIDASWALNTSSDSAGMLYFMLLGVSGTSPGTPVGGAIVPLNLDPITAAVIASPLNPPFANFFGVLDSAGRAQADLALGGVGTLGLAGTSLSATGIVIDPVLGTVEPSDAIDIPVLDY
jgi:predicted acyl esterase